MKKMGEAMAVTKAVITVGKPIRDGGEDIVKLTLHPRVGNYAVVASAIEAFFADKGVFKACRHAAGSGVWEAVLIEGTRLEGVHGALAGGLNTRADLPGNVVAVPEGAIPAFDEDDTVEDPTAEKLLRTMLGQLRGLQDEISGLSNRVDTLIVITEVALGEREI